MPVIAADSRSVAPDGAHRADRSDRALDARGEFADLLLLLLRRLADAAAQQRHADHGDADHDHDRQQQHRVDERHGDDRSDEQEAVADGIRQPLREHRVQECGVGADARDEVAGAAGVELADRQVQDARDELAAARVDDGGAGALQQVVLVARDDRRHDDERDDRPDEVAEILAVLDAGDDLAHQERLGEGRQSADDAQDADDRRARRCVRTGTAGAAGRSRAALPEGRGDRACGAAERWWTR